MSAGITAARPVGAADHARLVAEAADRLAAPSAVVAGALTLLDDPDVPLRRVAECIGESPELAAQAMRLASAAVNGRPAGSVEEAVVRIGTRALRGLLLAAETYPLMAGSLAVYGLPRMALVARATDTARAAHDVARRIAPADAAAAHVAGLLSDIGMPILADVAARAGVHDAAPADVAEERDIFGVDHAQVGATVAVRWDLGDGLAAAIAHHHDDEPPVEPVARAVWLASLVVAARGGDADAGSRVGEALARVGIDEAAAAALVVGAESHLAPERPPGLTDREVEVLRLAADGLAAKQVALALGCSPSTVHNHLHHIYRKLGVTGQAQALLLARDRGWV